MEAPVIRVAVMANTCGGTAWPANSVPTHPPGWLVARRTVPVAALLSDRLWLWSFR